MVGGTKNVNVLDFLGHCSHLSYGLYLNPHSQKSDADGLLLINPKSASLSLILHNLGMLSFIVYSPVHLLFSVPLLVVSLRSRTSYDDNHILLISCYCLIFYYNLH